MSGQIIPDKGQEAMWCVEEFYCFNVRMEVEDGEDMVCLWHGDEWYRISIPVANLPDFAEYLMAIHKKHS